MQTVPGVTRTDRRFCLKIRHRQNWALAVLPKAPKVPVPDRRKLEERKRVGWREKRKEREVERERKRERERESKPELTVSSCIKIYIKPKISCT